jgi:hypothetical protein
MEEDGFEGRQLAPAGDGAASAATPMADISGPTMVQMPSAAGAGPAGPRITLTVGHTATTRRLRADADAGWATQVKTVTGRSMPVAVSPFDTALAIKEQLEQRPDIGVRARPSVPAAAAGLRRGRSAAGAGAACTTANHLLRR